MFHKFADLFSELLESTFYKEVSSSESTELKVLELCEPVSAIFDFVLKIDNAAIIHAALHFGILFTHSSCLDFQELITRERIDF